MAVGVEFVERLPVGIDDFSICLPLIAAKKIMADPIAANGNPAPRLQPNASEVPAQYVRKEAERIRRRAGIQNETSKILEIVKNETMPATTIRAMNIQEGMRIPTLIAPRRPVSMRRRRFPLSPNQAIIAAPNS